MTSCFSPSASPIPHHIAIIPDGNRRWARGRDMKAQEGHWQGADSLIDIVRTAKAMGIRVLTIFGFSTENSTRSSEEVDAVMYIMERYLRGKVDDMTNHGIRCCSIGNTETLRPSLREALETAETATQHNRDIDFVLALNYGGRDDIRRACVNIAKDCVSGRVVPEDISEEVLADYLDTSPWPDPELLIRTSGEMRLSNFLLWQCSYTEIYTSDVLWPDFTPDHLHQAVAWFQKRTRRLGT